MRPLNALWLLAIAFAIGFGSVPVLLGILCVFVMEGVLELKAVRAYVATVAAVFATEPEPMTEARAEQMTAAVMERVRLEMTAASMRRPH